MIVNPDLTVRWSTPAPSQQTSGANLIFDGLDMTVPVPVTELGSAPVPEDDDHVRDGAALVIEYTDFECPFCAALHERLADLPGPDRLSSLPVRSSHPRAWAAAVPRRPCFWELHDSLFADQGRLEDPHLWDRARALGLSLERFDANRRSEAVLMRVRRDFAPVCVAGS